MPQKKVRREKFICPDWLEQHDEYYCVGKDGEPILEGNTIDIDYQGNSVYNSILEEHREFSDSFREIAFDFNLGRTGHDIEVFISDSLFDDEVKDENITSHHLLDIVNGDISELFETKAFDYCREMDNRNKFRITIDKIGEGEIYGTFDNCRFLMRDPYYYWSRYSKDINENMKNQINTKRKDDENNNIVFKEVIRRTLLEKEEIFYKGHTDEITSYILVRGLIK